MPCKNCKHVDKTGMCTWPDNNGPKLCENVEQAETQMKKPPLGLMPKRFWDKRRMCDIFDAMERYAAEGKAVPLEWVQELRRIELQ